MSLEGVAVTLYFGSKEDYIVVGYAGSRQEAQNYFTKLISEGRVIPIGPENINFAQVKHFTIKG